ncbi:hypothetical protein CHS0354_022204 [Potamilus streckersoni]|uniref:Uncharacterized protein n=1 Tax=Potamilus streckersoni TaxID=2493646 RepID=A0AAE0W5M8_9BIVA|nr:hypothetical protein CHS0354_022204 [Potamilus streckersoni]
MANIIPSGMERRIHIQQYNKLFSKELVFSLSIEQLYQSVFLPSVPYNRPLLSLPFLKHHQSVVSSTYHLFKQLQTLASPCNACNTISVTKIPSASMTIQDSNDTETTSHEGHFFKLEVPSEATENLHHSQYIIDSDMLMASSTTDELDVSTLLIDLANVSSLFEGRDENKIEMPRTSLSPEPISKPAITSHRPLTNDAIMYEKKMALVLNLKKKVSEERK